MRSGAGAKEVYTPRLLWVHIMDQFMRPTRRRRESQSTLTYPNAAPSRWCTGLPTSDSADPSGTSAEETPPMEPAPSFAGTSNPGKRRKVEQLTGAVNQLQQIAEMLHAFESREDDWDAYGQFTAKRMRTLAPYLATECQEEINNILNKYKQIASAATYVVQSTQPASNTPPLTQPSLNTPPPTQPAPYTPPLTQHAPYIVPPTQLHSYQPIQYISTYDTTQTPYIVQ